MKQLKLGIFGLWRGSSFIPIINALENATVHAICDKSEDRVTDALKSCPEGVKVCEDFDGLLDSGIDAVLLCNYFHEHAAYAIKTLDLPITIECQPGYRLDSVKVVGGGYDENDGTIYFRSENATVTVTFSPIPDSP